MRPAGEWWKSAVFYQVYPASFATSQGAPHGTGDLEGIRSRLDHLAWLGVDAIWLCPFYPSPWDDMGYDVADYFDVDPRFGTLADFDRLLADAHRRGIRVIVDWVPNHTSDRHRWFAEARSSRSDPRRDWYVWRDPAPGYVPGGPPGPRPNNWLAAFGGEAWTFDELTAQWYLHLFLPSQPDLNWDNPAVRGAMGDTLRFWLNRGVDGFRIDVVQGLAKDPALPDDPPGALPRASTNDHPGTHTILRELRQVTDSYPGEPALVGEVYLLATERVARYLAGGDQLHLAFDFTSLYAPWDPDAWRECLEGVAGHLDPIGAWPTWTLSNHDNPRHPTRYGRGEGVARAAAVALLTVRGTPFLYQGEELGLEDAVVAPPDMVDPGGRDGCRAPIPWDATPSHGWGRDDLWIAWPPDADVRNAESAAADGASILHLYRRLIAARRASPALSVGDQVVLDTPPGVLGWSRTHGADRRATLVNFTSDPVEGALVAGSWSVEVASDGRGEGEEWDGHLGPAAAVVLRPA